MKRPDDAISADALLELGVIAELDARELLGLWNRGISYQQALLELSGEAPPPDETQLAFERFKITDPAGAVQ